MIIVEGTDLVGKTTLCERLVQCSSYPLKYKHLSRLPDTFHRYYDYLPMIRPVNVYDRFHMSEIAYVAARREKQGSTNPMWYSALDRSIIKAAGMIVIITVDEYLIRERWGRDEMYKQDVVLRANDAFLEIATSSEFQGFNPYKSFHFHCNSSSPFVTDDQAQFLVTHHEALINRSAFLNATREFPRG